MKVVGRMSEVRAPAGEGGGGADVTRVDEDGEGADGWQRAVVREMVKR